ncbi:uncharacterized protein LOC101577620 isoform X2 [Octodon degus]|uniref:Uncharacterized protein LOC101577620 isoform X2 n=1 Tax=Octodon degus TaxID=10160 RepID=A0A6P6F596_OCTDE|nr:uncharacterized protein LOC101577620 isoform X2 [Octodon degus]
MVDYMFLLTRILFILCCCSVTVYCTQPNCTSVTDFHDCPGNVTNFCPENIVCACKDGKPFCKCPYFRGQWANYWYMGAKCDQLWNTLDLILVATLPGVGLALIVGITIQTIHYCKRKSKKNMDDSREQRVSSEYQPQDNPARASGDAMRPVQPDQVQYPWSSSRQGILPGSPVYASSQLSGRNNNLMIHETKENNLYNYVPHNWDSSWGTTKPEVNYGNKYSSTVQMNPYFDFSPPGLSKSSYIQRERQLSGYVSSEEPEIPHRIGRAQMKFNY